MRYFKKTVFLLITLLLAFSLSEIFLRLVGFKPDTRPFIVFEGNPERGLAEKGEDYNGEKKVVFVSDDALFWGFKPSSRIRMNPNHGMPGDFYDNYTINSHGFRGAEFDKRKKEGVYRIIALGDSITFGLGVSEPDTYYKRLEAYLNKKFSPLKVEVISMGVPGYTSYQVSNLIKKKALSYSPDMVIVYCGGNNEFAKGSFTDREYALRMDRAYLNRLSKNIFTLGLLDSLAQKIRGGVADSRINVYPGKEHNRFRVPPLDFTEDIVQMKRTFDSNGIDSVFIVPPHSGNNLAKQPYADEYASIVRFLGDYMIKTADADKLFKQQDSNALFIKDDFHPNEKGHEVIAGSLHDAVEEGIGNFFRKDQALLSKHYFSKDEARSLLYGLFKSEAGQLFSQALLSAYNFVPHNISSSGNAAYFNGKDSYLETTLGLGSLKSLTIMFWVKPADRQRSNIVVIFDSGHTADKNFALQSVDAHKGIYTFHCFGVDSIFYLSPRVWTNISVSIDLKDECFNLYINGQKEAHSKLSDAYEFNDEPLAFGRLSKRDSRYFKGAVSNIIVWGKMLNDWEIKLMYDILGPESKKSEAKR